MVNWLSGQTRGRVARERLMAYGGNLMLTLAARSSSGEEETEEAEGGRGA